MGLVEDELHKSQQCALAEEAAANSILGYSNRRMACSRGMWLYPSTQQLLGCPQNTVSSFRSPNTRKTLLNYREFRGRSPRWLGLGHLARKERLKELGLSGLEERWLQLELLVVHQFLEEVFEEVEPGSSEQCMAEGQKAVDRSCSKGFKLAVMKSFSLWSQSSSEAGCSDSWRFSRPNW